MLTPRTHQTTLRLTETTQTQTCTRQL